MRFRRAVAAGCAAAAVLATLTACGTDELPNDDVPVVGVLVNADRPCGATSEDVRRQADAVVERGLRDAGFRTVLVDCAGSSRDRYDGDRDYLAERGLALRFPDREQTRVAIHADQPYARTLRTAVTHRVMAAEPLVVSGDVAALPEPTNRVLVNREVLAFVTDERGAPGADVLGDPEVSSRAIGERGLLVAMNNRDEHRREMSVEISDLGLAGDDMVPARDVWSGREITSSDGVLRIEVPGGDTALLRIG
ncbi:hypothetical protein [Gordonia shandongensis]|uniref:hypothetical protein n=1 Tax=Gordonia shandongensis TaxID=376351 RepID=UPI0003FE0E7A|nr:hypothetical protein [Gordonia shandongensis]